MWMRLCFAVLFSFLFKRIESFGFGKLQQMSKIDKIVVIFFSLRVCPSITSLQTIYSKMFAFFWPKFDAAGQELIVSNHILHLSSRKT